MVIGDRLRQLREEKKFSQGDIEKRTGLLRCYISRVENGHTVPAVETLEKLARALEIPLYQLFYEGEEPPKLPNLLKRKASEDLVWGSKGKHANYLHQLRKCLSKAQDEDRKLIMYMAQKMANKAVAAQRKRRHKKSGLHRSAARVDRTVDVRYFFFSSFRCFAEGLSFFFESSAFTSLASLAMSTL